MTRPLVFLLGLVAGVALTFAFHAIAPNEPRSAAPAPATNVATTLAPDSAAPADAHATPPIATTALSRPAATPAASPPRPPAAPASPGSGPLGGMASLLKNPAMRDLVSAQMRQMNETKFGPLMDQLRFTAEERDQFLRLLGAQTNVDTDLGMRLMDKSLSADDRRSLMEELKRRKESSEAALREFFNSEQDYATYQTYAKDYDRRQGLRLLTPALERIGQPLSESQTGALLDILDDPGRDPDAETPPDDMATDPTSPGSVAYTLRSIARRQERILARAASILTPEQLEALRKNQEQQYQMMKMGLEMSRGLSR